MNYKVSSHSLSYTFIILENVLYFLNKTHKYKIVYNFRLVCSVEVLY